MINSNHVKSLIEQLPEIERKLSDPAIMANQKKFRELIQEHALLKELELQAQKFWNLEKEIIEHRQLIESDDTDADLKDLAGDEMAELETRLSAAEKELMAALLDPDPDEKRSVIIEIRAGTGGNEAALFAGDLFRMYNRYSEDMGWKTGMIDANPCEIGGYKEVVFSVDGQNVYGELRYEMGVHRVQRVPVTEASGRIHTSAATVAVFPKSEANDHIEINPAEIRTDIFCSSGPGGQSVNTTYSAVRITHLPTGIVAQSQDERSQHRNKEKAMSVLKARILDLKKREEEEKKGKDRRSQIGSGDRSERVRTYNFPQNRLTDHRVNLTLYSLDRIMEGNLSDLMTALRDNDLELRLKQMEE